jgi:spore coat protein U-like protein
MKRICLIAVLLLLACAAKPAAAVSCSTYSTQVVFGNYSGGIVDVTATITVQCDTAGTGVQIALNAGTTGGATITNRMMFGGTGGTNTLGYQLFSNASNTQNWGNSSATGWVTGTILAANTPQNYTVYAHMPANEISPTGSYTDTITITVSSPTGSFTPATGSFSVTATVVPSCSITASALNFGAYTGAAANATSTLTVQCASGTPYNVGLNAGTASGATVTTRKMMNSSNALSYSLFSDSGRTKNWGNTVGTDTLGGSGSGTAQTLTVYGQVPGGQKPVPGSYTDTVTATLTY